MIAPDDADVDQEEEDETADHFASPQHAKPKRTAATSTTSPRRQSPPSIGPTRLTTPASSKRDRAPLSGFTADGGAPAILGSDES